MNTPPPNNQHVSCEASAKREPARVLRSLGEAETSNRAYWLAAVCSLAWFALWLSAFRPIPEPAPEPMPRPAVAICSATDETLSRLRAPTLFALPSKEGFSGTFPEKRVNVRLSPERLRQPETYLARQPGTAAPDQTTLIERIPFPQSELPAPGATPTAVIRRPETIVFFFSPELASRATEIKPPSEIESLPDASVRIHLTVRPDGTVAHAFFETPMEQATLLSAVRKLRFTPAPEKTGGWLDIRFTPDRENRGENR